MRYRPLCAPFNAAGGSEPRSATLNRSSRSRWLGVRRLRALLKLKSSTVLCALGNSPARVTAPSTILGGGGSGHCSAIRAGAKGRKALAFSALARCVSRVTAPAAKWNSSMPTLSNTSAAASSRALGSSLASSGISWLAELARLSSQPVSISGRGNAGNNNRLLKISPAPSSNTPQRLSLLDTESAFAWSTRARAVLPYKSCIN